MKVSRLFTLDLDVVLELDTIIEKGKQSGYVNDVLKKSLGV